MGGDVTEAGIPVGLVREALDEGNVLAEIAAGAVELDAAGVEFALARWEAALFAIARAA
jgi:hypothetical protein